MIEPEGISDGEDLLSHFEVGARPDGERLQVALRRLDPDDREIEFRGDAHERSREVLVLQSHRDLGPSRALRHRLHHVIVGDDVALVVPHEPRTGPRRLLGNRAAPEVDLLLGGGDEGNRGLGLLEQGDGGPLVRVEVALPRAGLGPGLGLGHGRAGDRLFDVSPEVGSEGRAQEKGRKEDASKSHAWILGFGTDRTSKGKGPLTHNRSRHS